MDRNIILAILASALVTALMRTAPILLLSRFRLPSAQQQWLSFIPSAIMAAIVTAELVGKPVLTSVFQRWPLLPRRLLGWSRAVFSPP